MSFASDHPRSGEILRPSLRYILGTSLRAFADSIPDSATPATQEQRNEDERLELRGQFVDFVTDGALEIATILKERKAPPQYFSKLELGIIDPQSIGGFVLRQRVKYGGISRNPRDDIMPTHHRRSETSPLTHKLIILARTGELAIAGNRGQDVLLDVTPGPSQWFNESAIQDSSSFKNLKRLAQNDMERTLQTYLSRR